MDVRQDFLATQQVQEKTKEWGGVKNIEVVSEDVKENTANVKLKIIYENGKEMPENIKLKKVNGQWKISM
ncbi:DUF4878 domain-containing protein [Helicobacter saguini]|uniref:DUF4878 domain-containing protein n=1 Tax=Helicobacter saguini TaxID=1548018 RepID=A0A347VHM5_9HELI|nr:DUF4878 domain-containing protein [Helicobacter saguini]